MKVMGKKMMLVRRGLLPLKTHNGGHRHPVLGPITANLPETQKTQKIRRYVTQTPYDVNVIYS